MFLNLLRRRIFHKKNIYNNIRNLSTLILSVNYIIPDVDLDPYKWKLSNNNNNNNDNEKQQYYTSEEVSQHNSIENRVWVTYKDGVYDVTDFIQEHPGGSQRLLDAAGGAVDQFWAYWSYHYVSLKVIDALNKYRIGTLSDYNDDDHKDAHDIFYENEPERKKLKQRILTERPYCSESQPNALNEEGFITSNESFYVRNHAPVPIINSKYHNIDICYHGECKNVNINNLIELFPMKNIISVLQCAGNRSEEMSTRANQKTAFSHTPYASIKYGLIGNAKWSGIELNQVLKYYFKNQINNDINSKKHVHFEGVDGYVTSIPLNHILNEKNDVLLATHMNNVPLPLDHGYPIRVFLPGVAGARNVKWLSKIDIRDVESSDCWQSTYYKTTDVKSILQLPMQSLIFYPYENEEIKSNSLLTVKGIAWGGGSGNKIKEVKISIDNGKNWYNAQLDQTINNNNNESSRQWSWTPWTCDILIHDKTSSKIMVQAIDINNNKQPQDIYHPRGYLYNGWHYVNINVI